MDICSPVGGQREWWQQKPANWIACPTLAISACKYSIERM